MSAMNRRALIVALIGAPAALTRCSLFTTTSVPAAVQQVAGDVALVVQGLAAAVPELRAFVTAAQYATMQTIVTDTQSVATQITSAPTIAAAQSLVLQIEGSVNAIASAVASLNLPGQVGQIFSAIAALLPVIEIALNMLIPPAQAPAARLGHMRTALTPMSPDEARRILKAL